MGSCEGGAVGGTVDQLWGGSRGGELWRGTVGEAVGGGLLTSWGSCVGGAVWGDCMWELCGGKLCGGVVLEKLWGQLCFIHVSVLTSTQHERYGLCTCTVWLGMH